MSNELNYLFNSSKEDISLINKAYEKTQEIVRAGALFYKLLKIEELIKSNNKNAKIYFLQKEMQSNIKKYERLQSFLPIKISKTEYLNKNMEFYDNQLKNIALAEVGIYGNDEIKKQIKDYITRFSLKQNR